MKFFKLIFLLILIVAINTIIAQTSFNISNKTTGDTLLTIDNSGQMGLGITVPGAGLHMVHNNGALFSGTFGSGTIPVEGAGTRLMWYPAKSAFRVGRVSGSNWDNANIGNYSMALGNNTNASGDYSTALGWNTIASGFASTAFGRSTTASGINATALGIITAATGNYSTAMGNASSATGENSTAMGRMTWAAGMNSTALGNNIRAVGEGSVAIGLTDQSGLQVTQDSTMAIMGGNVGIGTIAPSTKLEVADTISSTFGGFKFPDGTVQQTAVSAAGGNTLDQAYDQGGAGAGRTITADNGAFTIAGTDGAFLGGSHGLGTIPVEGAGTRLMWYPRKAAFRAGYASGTNWDDVNIGDYSTAIGLGTMANGPYSTALGHSTTASGYYSTAIGRLTTASGFWSTAMGHSTTASGSYSTVMGGASIAGGPYSMAVGRNATASGPYSISIGQEIEASGISTFAIGLRDMNGLNVTQDSTLAIMGGRVGIGTAAPTEALEVADTIYSSIGGFKFPDQTVQATAFTAGGGNTLDQAYDQGGAGAGRTITVDAGAFEIAGIDGALFSGSVGSGTIPAEGLGTRMMWYPGKAAFRAGYVNGSTYWDDDSIGVYSLAAGLNTTASGIAASSFGWETSANGFYSTSLGINTIASGNGSTAMGDRTKASGLNSVSLGFFTTASGNNSIAFGQEIEASGLNTVAIGLGGVNGLNVSQDSTLAIMGGKVGIEVLAPSAELQVGGTEGVLFTGTYGSGTIPVEGPGTRMMWFPAKAAFRAGRVYASGSAYWDNDSIGSHSFAFGWNPRASGAYSIAMGRETNASGNLGATAMGYQTKASGVGATAMGYQTTASGTYSTALGRSTIASVNYSTAMGLQARASGVGATAMGRETNASGAYSIAMGRETNASGIGATAMGYNTHARGDYSTTSGYETITNGDYSIAMGREIYADGDYTVAIALSDQNGLSVSQNNTMAIMGGKVGIGVWRPNADLQLNGTDGVLFSGTYLSGSIPAEGEGTRMMWYPNKAAFRAGRLDYISRAYWDNDSIGSHSFASGLNTRASGDYSTAMGRETNAGPGATAMGYLTTASGSIATAIGYQTTASGFYSTAMGYNTTAAGDNSIAMGQNTMANGFESTAMGQGTMASGSSAIAMGNSTIASGSRSTAMGSLTRAGGEFSTAMGRVTEASGTSATATGSHTTASGENSTAMGNYVESSGDNSFTIGDLSTASVMNNSTSNRFMTRFANGYYLYTNSTISLGAALPANANSWVSVSDSTKKENFKAMDSEGFLNKISKFKLTSWNYKGQDPNQFRHYGPMAQDFYAAFGNDGIGTIGNDTTIASADFDGINFIAIQALEKRTTELKSENDQLKSQLTLLTAKMESFEAALKKLNKPKNLIISQ